MCSTRVVAAEAQIAWLRRVVMWQGAMISEQRRAVVGWKKLALLRALELDRVERRRLSQAGMPFLATPASDRANAAFPVTVGT